MLNCFQHQSAVSLVSLEVRYPPPPVCVAIIGFSMLLSSFSSIITYFFIFARGKLFIKKKDLRFSYLKSFLNFGAGIGLSSQAVARQVLLILVLASGYLPRRWPAKYCH